MSQRPLWAVLVPGELAWVESRARAALVLDEDEEHGKKPSYKVAPGQGRYHAILGLDDTDLGAELQIAEEISLECAEPVYSIEQASDTPFVTSFRHGVGQDEEQSPEALAKSLGCPLPDNEGASHFTTRAPLRSVAFIEGVRAEEARRAFEEDPGESLSLKRYRLTDTPQGLLLTSGTGGTHFADIILSERFPHATVYGVTASPTLDIFSVTLMTGGESIKEFAQPPNKFPPVPVAHEIKGERSPERILAALGIPAEWFRNE